MFNPRRALGMFAATFFLGLHGALSAGHQAKPATPVAAADAPKAATDDWPWWRGPTADGTSRHRQVTTRWSANENVVWKVNVPGRGHSSPIVCGTRVFLTTADEQAQEQRVLAFDRRTGKALWNTLVHQGGFPRKNPKNSHASATPACDGERVFSAFVFDDGLYVTATDLDGKILWQAAAGPFTSEHGYGSSPVLYQNLVIVNGDSLKGSFVAALDRKSGKTVWREERASTGRHGSYATPVVADIAGKPQLIMTGLSEVTSYDPATGKLLWSCAGPAEVTACTAACSERLVFATGGFPEKELLAIRADGRGDVTRTHVVWRLTKGVGYVPSPLYHAGRLYVVADNGIVTCLDADSGKEVWQGRLEGAFSSSPVLVGDLLYVSNEAGRTFVLKTGSKFDMVAANDLGDGCLATPAVCGGQIFLRTSHHLYCLASRVPDR
jgi:outer membrane protein assembly factor BamB